MPQRNLSVAILLSLVLCGVAIVYPLHVMGATPPSSIASLQPNNIYRVNDDSPCNSSCTGLTWTSAFTNLQDALAIANNGDEIWVAAGVYYPDEGIGQTNNLSTSTFALVNGVAMYGGFDGTETMRSQRNYAENITVLSGDIDQNDNTDADDIVTDTTNIMGTNALHVIQNTNVTSNTILDGFTITAGSATGSGVDGVGGGMRNSSSSPNLANITFSGNYANNNGGGIDNVNGSNPSLTNVTFTGNEAKNNGGGMSSGGPSGSNPTLIDVTFSNNLARRGGGMSNSNGSNTSLTTVVFTDNSAKIGGGMYNIGSSPTLTDVTFSGNHVITQGGGMYNENSSPIIQHTTFIGNSADEDGGGMDNTDSNPTLTNVDFISNSVTLHGGGISNNNSTPTLTNVTLSSNSAGGDGGGMRNVNNSNSTLTDVIFNGNTAEFGGGMYNDNSSPNLTRVIFDENWSDSGGGMYNTNNSNPNLNDVEFHDNSAPYGSGGGMLNVDNNPILRNVIFSGNSAGSGGGMGNNNASPSLTNVTFNNNRADRGGGMANISSSLHLTSVIFSGNQAIDGIFGDDGGGMFNSTSQFTLTNVTFIENSAFDLGGGTYNNDSFSSLENTTFDGNRAYGGGGLYNTSSSSSLINVSFNNNNANYRGGGVYNAASNLDLSNVIFSNNLASGDSYNGGGGIYNANSNANLVNVTFSGNIASRGGGMLNDSSDPSLVNVVFSGNQANGNGFEDDGGGLLNSGSKPSLTNVTFSGNTAVGSGGGIHNANNSNPTLTGVILWVNTAINSGSEISNTVDSTPVISYSLIRESGGSGDWDASLGINAGNNLDADPLFVMPINASDLPTTTGDLRLQVGSLAIGAGLNGDNIGRFDGSFTRPFDVAINKTVNTPTAVSSDRVTYTLVFSNQSDATAGVMTITDVLPAELSNIAVTSSGATIVNTGATPPTYIWTASTVAANSQAIITVSGQIDAAFEGTLVNIASVEGPFTATNPDPDRNNNNSSVSINVLVAENAPPEARDAHITPAPFPANDSPLTVIYDFFDPNGDEEKGTLIHWQRDGQVQPALNKLTTAPASTTYPGEEWCAIVTPSDGELYGNPIQACAYIGFKPNVPPQALDVTINPLGPSLSDPLEVTYVYSDVDGVQTPDSAIELRWYRNGVLQPAMDEAQIGWRDTEEDETWCATVRLSDGQDYGAVSKPACVIISPADNTLPRVLSATITPAHPDSGDGLTLHYNFVDDDNNDSESGTRIWWYRDDVLQPAFNNGQTVPSNVTLAGEAWHAAIQPSDGQDYGLRIETTPAIIQGNNTEPRALDVTITPAQPGSDENMRLTYVFTDADGDFEGSTRVQWYQNLTQREAYSGLTVIPADATAPGDVWYARVTPHDGQNYGPSVAAFSVAVENSTRNTPPQATNVYIYPAQPGPDDNLRLQYTYYDEEGDPEAETYFEWRSDGSIQNAASEATIISRDATVVGQEWCVQVIPGDGESLGDPAPARWQDNCVTIGSNQQNTPPVVSRTAYINPPHPSSEEFIELEYTYFDADKDSEDDTRIRWYRDEALVDEFNDKTIVPARATSSGQNWYATIEPYDGQDYGDLVQTPVVTINTPPEARNVQLVPFPELYGGQSLAVLYDYFDADNDPPADPTIQWYRNNEPVGEYANERIIPSGVVTTNEQWKVIIAVNDNTESSITETVEITALDRDGSAIYLPIVLNKPIPSNECNPDRYYEENDTHTIACPWPPISSTFVALPDDIEDIYSFVVNETSSVRVWADTYRATEPGQLLVYSENDRSRSIASVRYLQGSDSIPNTDSPDALKNLPPGNYFIRVYTYDGTFNANDPYQLYLTIVPRLR